SQLDKVDRVTDSAVDAVESVDTAIRTVSSAVTRPVQKVSGIAAGLSFGAADFKEKHDWRHAVQAGKEAAARREQELVEELRDAGSELATRSSSSFLRRWSSVRSSICSFDD